jgi:hypothetical protein
MNSLNPRLIKHRHHISALEHALQVIWKQAFFVHLTHFLHHIGHLHILLDDFIDVLNRRTGARRYTPFPRRGNKLWQLSFASSWS